MSIATLPQAQKVLELLVQSQISGECLQSLLASGALTALLVEAKNKFVGSLSKEQIAALKYLLFNAKVENPTVKQIFGLLIQSSRRITHEVCLTLVQDREGYSADEIREIAHASSILFSSNCTTHINEVLKAMGTEFRFDIHYGDFDPMREGDFFSTEGIFPWANESQVANIKLLTKGMPMRYTFWFAKKNYSREAELIVANREVIEKIDLLKPGLYPSLEK